MARKIECERCKKQTLLSEKNDWGVVDISQEDDGEVDASFDLCPACIVAVNNAIRTVEKPTQVTSEYCDYERHVVKNESDVCQCGKWKFTKELLVMTSMAEVAANEGLVISATADDDIPF